MHRGSTTLSIVLLNPSRTRDLLFLALFFRVTHDGLRARERGTTRSLLFIVSHATPFQHANQISELVQNFLFTVTSHSRLSINSSCCLAHNRKLCKISFITITSHSRLTGNYAKCPSSRCPPSHLLEFLFPSSCQKFCDQSNSIQALQLCNTFSTQQEFMQNIPYHVLLQVRSLDPSSSCQKPVI